MKYATILSISLMLGAPLAPAHARSCFRSSHVSHRSSSALVGTATVFQFVGAPYRVDALIEQQKRADPDYQEFLQFKKFKAEFEAFKAAGGAAAQAKQTPIQQHCAKCHGTGKPQSGKWNSDEPLTLSSLKKIVGRVTADADSGQMPPPDKHPITPDQRGELLQFLSQ